MKIFLRAVVISITALAVSILFSVNSYAASKIIISLEEVEGQPGKAVVVSINLSNNTGLSGASLVVNYDDDVLLLREINETNLLSGAMHSIINGSSQYLVWENDTSTTNFSGNGTLVELVFAISEDTAPGEYPITISAPKDGILDCNGNEVVCSLVNGAVIVAEEECTHEWGSWQKSSNSKHKRTCAICAEAEYAKHSWNDGEITEEPTQDETGLLTYTCSICSGTKTELIPVLPSEPEDGGVSIEAEGERTSAGVSVAVDVINENSTALRYHAISAAYDSNGRLVASDVVSKTASSNSTRSQTLSLTTTDRIVSVKLFLLDENHKPLKPAILVTLN